MSRAIPQLHRCHICRTVSPFVPARPPRDAPLAPWLCPACDAPMRNLRLGKLALATDLVTARYGLVLGPGDRPLSVREVFARECWDEREVGPQIEAVRRLDFDAWERRLQGWLALWPHSSRFPQKLQMLRRARVEMQSGELLRVIQAEGDLAREDLRAERAHCLRVFAERQREGG